MGKTQLVGNDQMVDYREHLTREHRVLFLSGVFTGETESHNLLLALDSISHKPIRLIITSPGGDLDSTFLFYDTMRLIQSPIETLGRYCASAAAIELAAGRKRYLLPHCKTMLHLPAGVAQGDAHDWAIQNKEMQKYERKMVDILIECGAKKSHGEIIADIDRDLWLEPEETIAYGLADKIMEPKDLEGWLK